METDAPLSGETLKHHISKKNSVIFVAEGMLFKLGLSFVDASAVISVFIFLLTGSAGMAGLVQVAFMAGLPLGNIIYGSRLSKIKNIPRFMGRQIAFSRIFLIFAAAALFLNISNYALGIIIIALYFITFFIQGTTMAPWQDLYSRTMVNEYRSTVMGYRQSLGALAGVAASLVIQRILANETMGFKTQYGIIIFIGALFLALCALPLSRLKETERPKTDQHDNEGIRNLLKRAIPILKKQKHFRGYLQVRILDMISFTVITFIIIASKDILQLTAAQVGILVVVRTVGRTVGGFFSGWFSKKAGNKALILIRYALMLGLSLCGVFLCLHIGLPTYFAYIFTALGGIADSAFLGYLIYMMYSMEDKARPDCITLDSLILLPFSFASLAMGILIDAAGYLPFFVAIGILCVAAFIFTAFRLLPKKEFDAIHPNIT